MSMADLSWLTVVPVATVFIMVIALILTTVNQVISRVLISHFIGWDKYQTMRKELAEYRKESMEAARAGDAKQLEKLKKKKSQIDAMQAQQFKPQMILMGISMLVYLPVWRVFLIPMFGGSMFGGVSIAFLPGFGLPLFVWYFLLSFLFSTLMQRILGAMPIE
jgi:uncharacterized membrane protein (DUF106 family)